ncbi:MAG: Gfo/Idh/MocA family oxidoreductase, partial [Clostridia bacterium]|nr:Gfo/Idh/MocA family oxidoreductase [Clostridia bacterium]
MASKTIRVACIGLGPRGRGLMKKMAKIPGAKIVGLFDPKPSSIEAAIKDCDTLGIKVKIYQSADEVYADSKVDAVVIATSWAGHVPLATAAMEAGKAVGMEVGPAMCMQDCYKLVEVQERTGMPFMFLENACYGRDELLAINMIKNNLFGEIIHTTAGYQHCVTD